MSHPVIQLRDGIRTIIRNLDAIESKNAFCCNCTYAQCHILAELARSGPITLIDLANILKVNKSGVSRTIDDLVGKGLVSRETDQSDRRYVTLQLTEAGKISAQEVDDNSWRQFEAILLEIPEEERQLTIKGLQHLNAALTKLLHPPQ